MLIGCRGIPFSATRWRQSCSPCAVYNCVQLHSYETLCTSIVQNCVQLWPRLHYAPLHNRGHWAHLLGRADSPSSALRWKFTRLFVAMSDLSLNFDRIFFCLYVEVRGIILPWILFPHLLFSANFVMVAISSCCYEVRENLNHAKC